jgi:hypothetical protein
VKEDEIVLVISSDRRVAAYNQKETDRLEKFMTTRENL